MVVRVGPKSTVSLPLIAPLTAAEFQAVVLGALHWITLKTHGAPDAPTHTPRPCPVELLDEDFLFTKINQSFASPGKKGIKSLFRDFSAVRSVGINSG